MRVFCLFVRFLLCCFVSCFRPESVKRGDFQTWVRALMYALVGSLVGAQGLYQTYHDITYATAITVTESESDFRITTDTIVALLGLFQYKDRLSRYMDFHFKNKTVVRQFYLYDRNFYMVWRRLCIETAPSFQTTTKNHRLCNARTDCDIPSNLLYMTHQIPKLKCISSCLAVVFPQSVEGRC